MSTGTGKWCLYGSAFQVRMLKYQIPSPKLKLIFKFFFLYQQWVRESSTILVILLYSVNLQTVEIVTLNHTIYLFYMSKWIEWNIACIGWIPRGIYLWGLRMGDFKAASCSNHYSFINFALFCTKNEQFWYWF